MAVLDVATGREKRWGVAAAVGSVSWAAASRGTVVFAAEPADCRSANVHLFEASLDRPDRPRLIATLPGCEVYGLAFDGRRVAVALFQLHTADETLASLLYLGTIGRKLVRIDATGGFNEGQFELMSPSFAGRWLYWAGGKVDGTDDNAILRRDLLTNRTSTSRLVNFPLGVAVDPLSPAAVPLVALGDAHTDDPRSVNHARLIHLHPQRRRGPCDQDHPTNQSCFIPWGQVH